MADDRPIAKLLFQDSVDAHAYGLQPDQIMYWCLAKMAGVDFEDFAEEDENRVDEMITDFFIEATVAPGGQDDATPTYTETGGVKYVELPLLYAAPRETIKFRRGTVRDRMETQQGDPGPPADQRLMVRLSGWDLAEIQQISLYDWNAIKEARQNFTSQPGPEVSKPD